MNLLDLVERVERALDEAGVSFGHGTQNAFDEAAWLVLWSLDLPLDTPLHSSGENGKAPVASPFSANQLARVDALLARRIQTRQPLAYLTKEAWLQGVRFYVDERAIVPRSLIAEPLVDGRLDTCLPHPPTRVLDVCTGNGSLAVLAALCYLQASITATDLSEDALAVAKINLQQYQLADRVSLLQGDALEVPALVQRGPFDLVLCNPPYVCAEGMATLPPEFLAEPALALDGNQAGGLDGMDFVRRLLRDLPKHLSPEGILVLEIGHERGHFEAAFADLPALWLQTSAGADQVLLVHGADLLAHRRQTAMKARHTA